MTHTTGAMRNEIISKRKQKLTYLWPLASVHAVYHIIEEFNVKFLVEVE